jgi:hypothetical protein
MLGVGKWKGSVSSMVFQGDVVLEILDNNGVYSFDIEIPGQDIPDFSVKDIAAEGNVLSAKANTSLLAGKDIDIELTFEENTFEGFLKIPFLGKVRIKNGVKVG